jgi:RNA polymerase sigma factor (TIGR02999 family)
MGESHDVTVLLGRIRSGEEAARAELYNVVYDELRRLARRHMKGERGAHTLQPTALVNEAFLRLFGDVVSATDRKHFFALASQTMRRVLVDHGRSRNAEKRGGGAEILSLDETNPAEGHDITDILILDEALSRLEKVDARPCRVVEMRFFAGLTESEIAEALSVSEITVRRDWRFARAWLYGEMGKRG